VLLFQFLKTSYCNVFGSKRYFVVDVFGLKRPPSTINVPSFKKLFPFAIVFSSKMPFIFVFLFLG